MDTWGYIAIALAVIALGVGLIFIVKKYVGKEEWFQVMAKTDPAKVEKVAKALGVRIATVADMEAAFKAGASLCSGGLTLKEKDSDPSKQDSWRMTYPMASASCGNKIGVINTGLWGAPPSPWFFNVVGRKPAKDDLAQWTAILKGFKADGTIHSYNDDGVLQPWNTDVWSRYSKPSA